MDVFKEQFLRMVAEKQKQGLIPRLTEEEQKRAEERIDAQVKELREIIEEAGSSLGDSLRRFSSLLEELGRKGYKASARAHRRHWRQLELARRKGRRDRKRRKRFR